MTSKIPAKEQVLLSEDTSNVMVSSYSCLLATATSTAQQNTTSSPSEDDPKADLGGLWDRAVNPGRRLSSCFSSTSACRFPPPGPGMLHLSVIGFSWKGVHPSHGTRGLKCLRAQWEWSQVIHSLHWFIVKLGAQSVSAFQIASVLPRNSFLLCQATYIHLQRACPM